MAEHVAAPSREQFRDRRRQRRLERRRAWVGLPMVVAGLGLIGTGVYVWIENNDAVTDPGVRVGGEVQVRTTTSVAPTTTIVTTTTPADLVPVELGPAVSTVAPSAPEAGTAPGATSSTTAP